MMTVNLISVGLTIFAAFLLTTRTWRQKLKMEDVIGPYEDDLAQLIEKLNKSTATDVDKHIIQLAVILEGKIAEDKDTIKDDVARAKVGIIVLMVATLLQSAALFY